MLKMNNKEDYLKILKDFCFTSHNIELQDDITTFTISNNSKKGSQYLKNVIGINYSDVPVMSEMPTYKAIKDLLKLVGFEKNKSNLKLLDLGCLEGGYAVEFARNGFQKVIGIEGRKSNFEKCEAVAHFLNLNNLEFRHDDVKNIKDYKESFDVVLCLGLLYHLDSPIEFLQTINNLLSDNGILFLETHYAPKNQNEHENFFLKNVYPDKKLYEVKYQNETYEGCWWFEYKSDTPDHKQHPWSAVSNDKSFVPTYQSLVNGIFNTGYKTIYVIQSPIITELEKTWYRILFACFKNT